MRKLLAIVFLVSLVFNAVSHLLLPFNLSPISFERRLVPTR
jgi:hypothetical protein